MRPTPHLRWHHTPWGSELVQMWVNDDCTKWEWRVIPALRGNFSGEGPPPVSGDHIKEQSK